MTEKELKEVLRDVPGADEAARAAAHAHWARLAKPLGGLGALETLVEAVPQTQGGRTLTEAQKARYAELKSEFDVQAHELLQRSEEKRREQETLNVHLKQKGELIASHRQELGNTRVGKRVVNDA